MNDEVETILKAMRKFIDGRRMKQDNQREAARLARQYERLRSGGPSVEETLQKLKGKNHE